MTRENEKGRMGRRRPVSASISVASRARDRSRSIAVDATARGAFASVVVVVEDARRASTRRRGSMPRDAARHRDRVRRHTSTTRGDSDGEGRCERCEWCRRRRSREAWDDGGGRAREGRRGTRARPLLGWGRGRRGRDACARDDAREGSRREENRTRVRVCRTAWTNSCASTRETPRRRWVARRRTREDDDRASTRIGRGARTSYDGVFALLFLNFALFACDHWGHMSFVKTLYLNHARPAWWQVATSTFCHANWAHLSSNIFFLYIFGKLIEEEEGAFGVWMSYLVTGIGANLASWFLLPKSVGGVLGIGGAATVSLGASGAVFGLFAVSVLVKLSWNWRRLLEVVILGQFVVDRFLSEAKMIAAAGSGVGAGNVNHVAHLGGAIAGVLLIIFSSAWCRNDVVDCDEYGSGRRKILFDRSTVSARSRVHY